MAYTTKIAWEPLRSIDSATFTGSYQAIGFSATPLVAAPLQQASYILKLINNSTSLVTISIDGTNDIDVAPANSFWLYDEYKGIVREGLPAGTQIFVKGSAGTGSVYLVNQYLVKS